MKRREFLKRTGAAAVAAPVILSGVNVAKAAPIFDKLASAATAEDRVLVLIQLNGGNDGLNTVIPLDQYSALFKARENILVPEAQTLKLTESTGLHPAMRKLHDLWSEGCIGIAQNVGYENQNFSHFRSTDIWTSASDYNQNVTSGWLGRYLSDKHPEFPKDYPNGENPDPLSLTIGPVVSTTCQGLVYNMGMAITGISIYDLQNPGNAALPEGPAGLQLDYVRTIIAQTNVYADVIESAASKAQNKSQKYPAENANKLADQLKIVARLIAGGLKTKIYVCQLGGFDTHAAQIETEGGTAGSHATLLGWVAEAVDAFMDDLKLLGAADKVVGMTFSEFGRRIASNFSLGTDHGSAAPLFVFGPHVNPVIHGSNPVIPSETAVDDNLQHEIDFRSVYWSLLLDWFEVPEYKLEQLLFRKFDYVPLIKKSGTSVEAEGSFHEELVITNIYPNPAASRAVISFRTGTEKASLMLFDNTGRKIAHMAEAGSGEHSYETDLSSLPAGHYNVVLKNGSGYVSKALKVVK